MDSTGPTPDAPTGPTTPPPPAGPSYPSGPSTPAPSSPSVPASVSMPASPPAPDASPPMRRGLFGARGPVTPEQQARVAKSRVRILGFSVTALSALMLVTIVMGALTYESHVENNLKNFPGGTFSVVASPADANWTVTLAEYGTDSVFNTTTTDASGRISYGTVNHTTFTLTAVRNGTVVKGGVHVLSGQNLTLAVSPATASSKWLNGAPTLPEGLVWLYGGFAVAFAIGTAGGVAAILRKRRTLAMAGAGAIAGVSVSLIAMTLFVFGGQPGLFPMLFGVLGVWAFITFRKNPQAFEPAIPTP